MNIHNQYFNKFNKYIYITGNILIGYLFFNNCPIIQKSEKYKNTDCFLNIA